MYIYIYCHLVQIYIYIIVQIHIYVVYIKHKIYYHLIQLYVFVYVYVCIHIYTYINENPSLRRYILNLRIMIIEEDIPQNTNNLVKNYASWFTAIYSLGMKVFIKMQIKEKNHLLEL